jgi:hypothetical protein
MTCLASATPRNDSSFRVTQPMHVSAGERPTTDYTFRFCSWPAPQNPALIPLGAPRSRGVGRRSPLIGADLAAAGSVPSSASTVICGGVAGPIGCAGRCGGRTTERLHEGGLPPKRLNLSKSNLPKEGRGLCRGALVSQPLELFRSVQTDSTFVLTGPGGSETRSSSLVQPFVEGVRAHVAQEQPNDGWCVGWSVDTFHLTHPR